MKTVDKNSLKVSLQGLRTKLRKMYFGIIDTDIDRDTLAKILANIDSSIELVGGRTSHTNYIREFYEMDDLDV